MQSRNDFKISNNINADDANDLVDEEWLDTWIYREAA